MIEMRLLNKRKRKRTTKKDQT